MTRTEDPRTELLGMAERLRHVRGEHLRAHAGGAVRRKLKAEMDDVAARLERRLAALVADETDREAWRAHARHGAPAPERPEEVEEVAPAGEGPPERQSGFRPRPR